MVVVDLDAFDANAADLVRRAAGKPLRVASKSLRVPPSSSGRWGLPGSPGCWPTRCARRSGWSGRSVTDHVVMGYPTVDRGALTRLLADEHARRSITLMVDDALHLALVEVVRAGGRSGAGPGRARRRCGPAARDGARRAQALAPPRRRRRGHARPRGRGARVRPGRGDDLRGSGRRRPGRRTPRPGPVRGRTPAQVRLGRSAHRAPDGRSRRRWARSPRSSSGTPAAPAAWRRAAPTRSSPRWPPAPGCSCRDSSTTTRASCRGRRRTSVSRSYAAPPPGSSPSPEVASWPADPPARTGHRCPGPRPTCT